MLAFEVDLMTFYRAVGLTGFATYVLVYALLGWRIIAGDSLVYFGGNTLAAAMVLISNFGEFNLASVLIQVFFIVIGTSAILLRFREKPQPLQQPEHP